MTSPCSFAELHRLDEPAVRDLLATGDPVERIWAVWSLALRAGDAELAAHLTTEPSTGVRRTLAVVLAGHGHLELLRELACADPDPDVRAAAMRLVILQAAGGRLPWSLVIERYAREAGTGRTTILGQLGPGVPAEVRELAVLGATDEDRHVRREAFEALLRLRSTDPTMLAPIHRWLDQASDHDRELALTRWSLVEPMTSVIAAVVGASRPVREAVIRTLRVTGWRAVAPLVETDPELLEIVWWSCQFDLADVPLATLVEVTRVPHWGHCLAELARRLDDGLAVPEPLRPRMSEIADRCRTLLDEIAAHGDLPDDEDAWDTELLTRAHDLLRAACAACAG